MNSNFKDSFYKILAGTELKDRLNKSVTIEEVYNVFKSAGYTGSSKDLEGEIKDVVRNFVKAKDTSEEDLSQVAGGKGPGAVKKMSAAALALMGVASAAATSTHAAPGGFESAKSTVSKYWQDRRIRNMITHATALVGGAGLGAVLVEAGWLIFGGKGGKDTQVIQASAREYLRKVDGALDSACSIIDGIASSRSKTVGGTNVSTAATEKDPGTAALEGAKGRIVELVGNMQGQGLLVRNFNKDDFGKNLKEKYENIDDVAGDLCKLFAYLNLGDRVRETVPDESSAKKFMEWAAGLRMGIQSEFQKEFEVGKDGVSLENFISSRGDAVRVNTANVQNKLFKDMKDDSNSQTNGALFANVLAAIGESSESEINAGAYTAFVKGLGNLKMFNQSFLENTDNDHVEGMLKWLKAALEDNNNTGAGALLALLSNRDAGTGAELTGGNSKSKHVETIKNLKSISAQNLEDVKAAVKEFATATQYFQSNDNVPPMLKELATQIDKLNAALNDDNNNLIKYLEASDDDGKKGVLQALLAEKLNNVMTDLTLEANSQGAVPAINTTDIKNVEILLQAIDTAAGKAKTGAIQVVTGAKETADGEAGKQEDEQQKADALEAAQKEFNEAKTTAEAAYKKVTEATAEVRTLVNSLKGGNIDLSNFGIDTAAIGAIIG